MNSDLATINPVEAVKLEKAAQILDLVRNGYTITDACKEVGVDYRTHRNWVKNGVYGILVGDSLQEITTIVNDKVVSKWGEMLEAVSRIALGDGEEVYPRDQMAAIKFLFENIIKPTLETQPEGSNMELDYLSSHSGFDWTPQLHGTEIVVTTTISEKEGQVIDVTAEEMG